MGKKRIIRKSGGSVDAGLKSRSLARVAKRNLTGGTLNIHATYNNTKVLLADINGNTVAWSSSGALGFSGAKKGTPFAAGVTAGMRELRKVTIDAYTPQFFFRRIPSEEIFAVGKPSFFPTPLPCITLPRILTSIKIS